jgi:hypothetical protein
MHLLLETFVPLAILGILLTACMWGVTRTRHKRLRQIGIFCVVIGVIVLPWLLNAFTIGVLFEWYRHTNPYGAWDINLTYIYLVNLVLLYVEAFAIALVFWFRCRRSAVGATSL